jgi:hypothetical protein
METMEVINRLKKPGFFEVYAKSTFQCYRQKKSGGVQKVTVDILDSGSPNEHRYHCTATADDGATASGKACRPGRGIRCLAGTCRFRKCLPQLRVESR